MTQQSPAFLPPPPKRGPGVRRLNRWPIWLGVGAASIVASGIGWTLHVRSQQAAQLALAQQTGDAGKASWMDREPDDGVILASAGNRNFRQAGEMPADTQPSGAATAQPSDGTQQAQNEDPRTKALRLAWEEYYRQIGDLQKQRFELSLAAMKAPISGAGGNSPANVPGQPPQGAPPNPGVSAAGGYPGGPGDAYAAGYGFPGSPVLPDATGAREKQAFLAQQGSTGMNDTLIATVRDPFSPNVVSQGDYIPLTLRGGAGSDTPGQTVAQVSADVCDSATGHILLIPQYSKVVGTYDNVVSAGQDRLPAVLNRIIFPDGSSISIGAMPAADQSGFSGMHDQVDHHYFEKFGNAVIIGIAAAGIQLSQPQNNSRNGYDSQQIVAGTLGQQFGQLGQEIARSGQSIPNTIAIRPGYNLTLQVTKDMILRPYVDRRPIQDVRVGPCV